MIKHKGGRRGGEGEGKERGEREVREGVIKRGELKERILYWYCAGAEVSLVWTLFLFYNINNYEG